MAKPVFMAFLFDASGSMQPYADDVIAGHKLMLDTLRESKEVKIDKVVYIYQMLFAGGDPEILQQFDKLSADGKDNIVCLTTGNYRPAGQTALFDAILVAINDLEQVIRNAHKDGMGGSARIAVITDGEDNCSTATAENVRQAVQNLRNKELIASSVMLGLKNQDFSDDKLEALRSASGFSQAVSLRREPREIRRAFVLASKPRNDR